MRIKAGALALFFMQSVSADTAVITWDDVLGPNTEGYRVYEYIKGRKILRYEGRETEYRQELQNSTVFGVATYNQFSESDVIPRAVIIDHTPDPVRWTITIEAD